MCLGLWYLRCAPPSKYRTYDVLPTVFVCVIPSCQKDCTWGRRGRDMNTQAFSFLFVSSQQSRLPFDQVLTPLHLTVWTLISIYSCSRGWILGIKMGIKWDWYCWYCRYPKCLELQSGRSYFIALSQGRPTKLYPGSQLLGGSLANQKNDLLNCFHYCVKCVSVTIPKISMMQWDKTLSLPIP